MSIDGAKRFDFAKVLAAYQRLIDALAAEFGETCALVQGETSTRRYPWTLDGKRRAVEFWLKAKGEADTSDERLYHPAGPVTAQAYLLGNVALIGDWRLHSFAPTSGGDITTLANEPVVRLFGRVLSSDGFVMCAMPTDEQLARAERVVRGMADLALTCSMSAPVRQPQGGLERYAEIVFPHDVYGDGIGRIRIRLRPALPGKAKIFN
jgi:hypothetical protein